MASKGYHKGDGFRIEWDTTKLDYLADHIEEALGQIMLETAEQAVATAKRLAPVDTGELRDSIDYELDPDGLGAEITADAAHAVFQELGTKHVRPQPFIAPAMDEAQVTIRRKLERVIEETAAKG